MSPARQIRDDHDLTTSLSRVRYIYNAEPYLHSKRMRQAPAMTLEHKARRSEWANTHISWTQFQWDNVIWSEEKRFRLNGPDDQAYFWANKQCRERIFTKGYTGSGDVIVWGPFSSEGVSQLWFIEPKMISQLYCEVLEEYFLFLCTVSMELTLPPTFCLRRITLGLVLPGL